MSDFDLAQSSDLLFQILSNVSDLRNVKMTKVRHDKEEQGKIKIEEWFEITGSINVPEGGKSFWAISKESSIKEPYNFFIRIDRNIEAEDYETAQNRAHDWVLAVFIKPLEAKLNFEEKHLSAPDKLSKIAQKLG
ncbi:MAG: hypothetical protein ACFE8F_00240 [Promethearchaeota archaeon]